MSAFVYTAFKTTSINPKLHGHVTTSFTEINRKLPKISTVYFAITGVVKSVEYWEESNVTVALLDIPLSHSKQQLYAHQNSLIDRGFEYGYEFKPHITLGSGNTADENQDLVGVKVSFGEEYIGFLYKE